MRGGWRAAALLLVLIAPPAQAQEIQVDLELVLAVDVSQSVDPREGRMQRDGIVTALPVLRSHRWSASQGDEQNQLQRLPVFA